MITFVDNYEEFDKSLEWLSGKTLLGLDTEATGLDPHVDKILLIQVGDDERQYVFDAYSIRDRVIELLDTINKPWIKLILHNAVYDYSMIFTNYKYRLDNIVCTMMANKLLNQGRITERHSLAAVLEKYLDVKMDKEERSSFQYMALGNKFTEEQIMYAGLDVKYLPKLYTILQALLDQRGMKLVSDVEYETVKVTAEMQVAGTYVDPKLWLDLKNEANKSMLEAKAELE